MFGEVRVIYLACRKVVNPIKWTSQPITTCPDCGKVIEPKGLNKATDLRTSLVEEEKRRELHGKGLNDCDIGRLRGVSGAAIGAWRRMRELNSPRRSFSRRLELYEQGLNDAEIARREGIKNRETIRNWREVRGLPPNRCPSLSRPDLRISKLSAVSGVSEPTIRSNIRLLLGELEPQKIVAINEV